MDKSSVTTETKQNILIVTIQATALSSRVLDDLNSALDIITSSHKGVVFNSSSDKIFLAGADLYAVKEMLDADDELVAREFIQQGQRTFTRIEQLKIPTVAAISGMCLGGGYELALACRYRIATTDKNTKIGLPEVTLGIIPAWGGTTRLPKLIGLRESLTAILTGKLYAAKPAYKIGIIDRLCHKESLLKEAISAAKNVPKRVAKTSWVPSSIVYRVARKNVLKKTKGNYPAPLKIIETLKESASLAPEDSFKLEEDAFIYLARTPECASLLRIFFLQEKSKKLMTGGHKIGRVNDTVVVGAGTMGAGIAQWLSSRGLNVLLKDVNDESIDRGLKQIGKLFVDGVRKHKVDRPTARDSLSRISSTTDNVSLHSKDLVIEAIVERLDVKQKVLAQLEETLPDGAIIATNTSALSIDEMAESLKHPERFVGIHFFNPVHQMKLVEVIKGRQTSDETVERAVKFVQSIGKLPIVVKDSPGFVVNRVLVPYLVKSAELLDQEFDMTAIDNAMVKFGMPMGPFRLMDEIGLDVCYHVARDLEQRLDIQSDGISHLVSRIGQKELGKKTSKGFYTYKNGKAVRKKSNQNVSSAAMTLVDTMIDESQKIVAEGVVESSDMLDFAMIMGTGWAPFRGGPLYYDESRHELSSF